MPSVCLRSMKPLQARHHGLRADEGAPDGGHHDHRVERGQIMPRHSSGTVYEQPSGSGRWHAKFTTTRGRCAIRLLTCKTEAQARARCAFISEHLKQLRAAGREDFAHKLLELAGKAEPKDLDRLARGVLAIASGDFDRPTETQSPLAPTLTFKEFAERWTSGELHQTYPDHVKRKGSVDDDCYRLQAHLFPIVGDVPLTDFRFEHAELAMRSLPSELSSGSRRHIAQLISRILRLAVYPGRIIEQSPIPKGFLPKPHGNRAQAWLYPAEERRLLAKTSIPLSHRLLYGLLAREGMRTSEAGLLTWEISTSNVAQSRSTKTKPMTRAPGCSTRG